MARTDNFSLQNRRRRIRFSGGQMAEALGVSIAAISRFETSNVPLPRGVTRKTYIEVLRAAEAREGVTP